MIHGIPWLRWVWALSSLGVVFGCSGGSSTNPQSTAGMAAFAGSTNTSSGGASLITGGAPTTLPDGGRAASGGADTGGSTASGASSGGTSSGGATNSATGGNASGGEATGGRMPSGGAPTGGAAAGGAATGGRMPSGGAPTGGAAAGGAATGGVTTGGVTSGGVATGGTQACIAPSVTKDSESQIALSGYTAVSYGGYLNGESFQQEGILTYKGYQYTAFWNTNRQVVLARRRLATASNATNGQWEKFDFTDYTNTEADGHNTISLGISPGDGVLHVSFDHHTSTLHYRRSNLDILNNAGSTAWLAANFTPVSNALVVATVVNQVTYPRFITEPSGTKVLFSARLGSSGSGDEHLWEYDTANGSWTYLGKYLDGISASVNAYVHGISYTPGGTRLHLSWCWRATADAATNFDLYYLYSDDNGRTWKNSAGATAAVTGSSAVTLGSSSNARVWTINQNRGLINQEHMAVDPAGRVHVLLSHMPDSQADDSNFTSARTKSQYFHYMRNTDGTWVRRSVATTPVMLNFRGKLAIASTNNVYAVVPTPSSSNSAQAAFRILAASPCDNFATWTALTTDSSRAYFSDPLIDSLRLASSDNLTIYYPQQSSVNIWALEYTLK